jgi:pimeloyl-ACP methyl ester carboxylesterase
MSLLQGYPGVLSEINSIDAVMRYAIDELGFAVDSIVVFAWSIGGYSACWTAVNYQNIRGLVLDDVLPLAQRQMPAFAANFVEKTIRYYLDLNNTQLLKLYNGSFYLIRRTQDEIISLIPGRLESNRGNELLYQVLLYRYPKIYDDDQTLSLLRRFLVANEIQRINLYDQYCSNERELQTRCSDYRLQQPNSSYPCDFGKNE